MVWGRRGRKMGHIKKLFFLYFSNNNPKTKHNKRAAARKLMLKVEKIKTTKHRGETLKKI